MEGKDYREHSACEISWQNQQEQFRLSGVILIELN
jgi:hypothetical protein